MSVTQGEIIAYKYGDFSSPRERVLQTENSKEISTLVKSIADKERERILEWSLWRYV
jgi:hypothetical protein